MRISGIGLDQKAAPATTEAALPSSPLTWSVPYAINRFLAGVFYVPYFLVNRSLCLVDLAFGFKLLVAGDAARNFLALPHNLIFCTFYVFLVHKAPLTW
jgi:hypothetical protein